MTPHRPEKVRVPWRRLIPAVCFAGMLSLLCCNCPHVDRLVPVTGTLECPEDVTATVRLTIADSRGEAINHFDLPCGSFSVFFDPRHTKGPFFAQAVAAPGLASARVGPLDIRPSKWNLGTLRLSQR